MDGFSSIIIISRKRPNTPTLKKWKYLRGISCENCAGHFRSFLRSWFRLLYSLLPRIWYRGIRQLGLTQNENLMDSDNEVCLFFFFYLTGPGFLKCSPGWRYFQESCYRLDTTTLSFAGAEKKCSKAGGHLVDINSGDENRFVGRLSSKNGIWIGLTDRATEGTWAWVSGKAVSFTTWFASPTIDSDQNCAVLFNNNGNWKWSEYPCSPQVTVPHVCETGRV